MRKELLKNLKLDDGHLTLEIFESEGEHIIRGVLSDENGKWYPVERGVPCFLDGGLRPDQSKFREEHELQPINAENADLTESEQLETNVTFSDKWGKFRDYGTLAEHQEFLFDWYVKKFGLSNIDELREFYSGKKRVLEVGPGSGFNAQFVSASTKGEVFTVDISEAAYTTYGNTHQFPNCHAIQADLMQTPFEDEYFDFIMADGVLHHTPNTQAAVNALYKKLAPGGQMFFYIYKQMGAMRRFADEYVRERFTKMTPDACYAACEGFTELGKALSAVNQSITLEKGIDVLGIPAGTHDVQRLMYYNFVKCFWNDAFDWETNNMVNFDWYHPHNAWQHTEGEVTDWLVALGASSYQFNDANPNGISVMVTKATT